MLFSGSLTHFVSSGGGLVRSYVSTLSVRPPLGVVGWGCRTDKLNSGWRVCDGAADGALGGCSYRDCRRVD